jgi:hypothetical protein
MKRSSQRSLGAAVKLNKACREISVFFTLLRQEKNTVHPSHVVLKSSLVHGRNHTFELFAKIITNTSSWVS